MMPRFKARPSPAVPLALANGSGTGTGTSSEIQVRTGKLYLVKTGCPPVVRLATAVRTMKHHLSGRLQVYVSFPNKDKRHDVLLDIAAFVEAYDPATVQVDAEGRLVRRLEQTTEPSGQDGVNANGSGEQAAAGGVAVGAVMAGSLPSVQIETAPVSPRTAKRRRLNRDAPTTPSTELLDPNPANLFQAIHTPHSRTATPDKEHEAMTRVRNFDHVRFSNFLIKTWYYSPYVFPIDDPTPSTSSAQTVSLERQISGKKRGRDSLLSLAQAQSPHIAKAGISQTPNASHTNTATERPKVKSVSEMLGGAPSKRSSTSSAPGDRLFVCYKCFKYTRDLQRSRDHDIACFLYSPPGRQVYQRPDSQFTIWEVDGAAVPLYCQNLSLFGKLFIDHKSVFFHVENFLFYIACINTTSKYEQPVAFFSKEKVSYDDYNLACIVTFPPWQKTYKLGRLLIEFSYLLTRHPSTRPRTLSPGTPERPISDLGMKGYAAYWKSTVLRYLRTVYRTLGAALPPVDPHHPISPTKTKGIIDTNGRGKVAVLEMTIKDLARAVHLTEDDTAWTLQQLGLVKRRERRRGRVAAAGAETGRADSQMAAGGLTTATPMVEAKPSDADPVSRDSSARINGHHLSNGNRAGAGDDHEKDDGIEDDEDEDEDEDDDRNLAESSNKGNKHRQWTLDVSKNKIDELCAQHRVTELPLLLESAVKL